MIEVKFDNEDGSQEVLQVPSKKAVCGRCRGEGTQDCFDGGMTGDEMAEQGPEFIEDYVNGVYDKLCEECGGLRVVDVIDASRANVFQIEFYNRAQEQQQAYEAERAHQIRMGY